MMLLRKIHKNKLLQIVLSVILCFALMFCIVSKSVEVKAVAGVDDAIFWAVVAALAEMGIIVTVTDPEVREAVADFFWSCADTIRDDIGMIAAAVKVGYSVYYNASVEAWSRIANAISEWFTTDRYPQSSIVYGNVVANNNTVDLNTAGSLTFNFPDFSTSDTAVINFVVNDCIFTYYYHPSRSIYYALQGETSSDTSLMSTTCLFVISPLNSDVDVYFVYLNAGGGSNLSGNSYYNRPFDAHYTTDVYGFNFSMPFRSENTYFAFNTICSSSNSGTGYFMIDGIKCKLSAYRNQLASFVDENDNVVNNLTFDDGLSALAWFFDLCGINIRPNAATPYVPAAIETDPIVIDSDAVQNALDNIADLPADSTVPLILPGTEAQYNQLISSVPVSGLYDADIDMPTVNGNLWKTKFPFCIPFDLINLFSGFSAEAEAPNFHVLVMPANSFGLDNDDIYWDIDFAPYNYLVQILRFFIALGFVLWLIVITRKLIRG